MSYDHVPDQPFADVLSGILVSLLPESAIFKSRIRTQVVTLVAMPLSEMILLLVIAKTKFTLYAHVYVSLS